MKSAEEFARECWNELFDNAFLNKDLQILSNHLKSFANSHLELIAKESAATETDVGKGLAKILRRYAEENLS